MPPTAKKAAAEETKPAAKTEETPVRDPNACVVDAPFHVGRAVNGRVCSYHAISHRADGTPR